MQVASLPSFDCKSRLSFPNTRWSLVGLKEGGGGEESKFFLPEDLMAAADVSLSPSSPVCVSLLSDRGI